ncbi:phage replisome organizer N-terminal domain-containing protein [Anaerocolumna xylanovorans]|uniref:Phage replisome organizer, putative, N-terminal region n=1 Tax=Anaerocolumna xylanovorans DSM 12503 TaxID=1121345 RepID=A0A1M7YBZ1_9FIRM|nr:phage replisome organizer N-terminal domain-containing protein [Anaerocolumna xylanovorans]SHO50145.1 phage replisome organizer, putative, N-terminal region [Anaerocolumna xylanovorans DSM 12503]
MAEINWIKLRIDMFDDEKIKIIQSMPEGDSILVIWIRLIALAGKCNANGLVLVEDEFPYSDEMLSVIFNKSLTVVRLALSTFSKFHMVENTQKGIYITNFDKHQNVEGMDKIREQNRLRKQRERERKRALLLESSEEEVPELPCFDNEESHAENVTCHVTSQEMSCEVTQQRENKNKRKNKDINNISSYEDIVGDPLPETPKQRIDYEEIMNDYNSTCRSLPSIRAVPEARKKKIKSLLNELDKLKLFSDKTPYERLHIVFKMANESDFLSGRNGKWTGCSFDWLLNKTNVLKILEGNYTNERGGNDGRINSGNNEQNVPGSDSATSEALERFRRNSGNAGL